ncbi:unnamed protein product [Schistosoma rodhaini]|uniref:MARVEL domain-containing protein n=1 Tax=Schistosoma rodhaini TaxID=6188 RepID=A0AA85GB15_9TREM|nr:unnamed protein product [Schistosoma rodhaini]
MSIKTSHPQIILYWMELILGIICIALAGKGYNELGLQYLIGIGTFSSIGNIVFLLLYGFATTRPLDGWSIIKLIETIYQFTVTLLYCIAIGVTFNQIDYLQYFIGPITIFTSANFGAFTFGSMVALTELICKHPDINTTDNPTTNNNTINTPVNTNLNSTPIQPVNQVNPNK